MAKAKPSKQGMDRFSGNGRGIVNVSKPTPEQKAAIREWNESQQAKGRTSKKKG